MTQDQIHLLFKQAYNQANWKHFLGETFTKARILTNPEMLMGIDSNVASKALKLGYVNLDENGFERQIAVYEVTLAKGIILERNRVGLRNLLRKYWKNIDAAFIVYHNPDASSGSAQAKWRFSYVSELTGYDTDGNVQKIQTEPKRYTYLLGEGESTRTAAERFALIAKKGSKANLDDVKEAFSVEKLSKAFFDEYEKHYKIFRDYMMVEPGIKANIFDGDEKAIRDFTKKLLGRIVFLYFIQKKGWLGVPLKSKWGEGNFNFLSDHFNRFQNQDLFYQDFLCPLFFETLNQKRDDDISDFMTRSNQSNPQNKSSEICRIPYLNGGLFEEDDKKHRNLILNAKLFQNLFDFFNQYNFTIYEDDPNDHTIAVDPEMLGHIFENLLEDNKVNGTFYTPKEIVHYMCQESLIEYLKTWFENMGYEITDYLGFDKPDQNSLFSANEGKKGQMVLETEPQISISNSLVSTGKQINRVLIEKLLKKKLDENDKILVKQHAAEFDEALDSVRICDPAIGSGAFPMGLLQEIFTAKQTLWYFEHGNLADFPASEVKLNIIQHSIYGVDIEKGAVDIARLRFWLSLVVDEEEPKTLPNLDYKIVVGNSLVSKLGDDIIDIDWSSDTTKEGAFGQKYLVEIKQILQKITREQKEFFHPDSEKKKLAADIRKLKIDLLINQLELMVNTKGIETKPGITGNKVPEKTELYLQTIGWKDSIKQLKKLKLQPDQQLNFFDWKLDFPNVLNELINRNPGFDIVIGNPPYVQLQKDGGKLAVELENMKYETFTRTGDIYAIFYEKGINLLKENGLLMFITSNKWMRAGYGEKLRQFFAKHDPMILVDLGSSVFESATVDTNILMVRNNSLRTRHDVPAQKHNLRAVTINSKNKGNIDINSFLQNEGVVISNLTKDAWTISGDAEIKIKEKIEQIGTPLKDWDINIYRGIVTGFNDAFIIDGSTKDRLIAEDPKSAEIIKPILRGKDIKRYKAEFADKWLIFIPWHFPLHNDATVSGASQKAEEAFANEYTAIYKHLLKFKSQLSKRNKAETGIRYEWYALQRCANTYYEEFEKEKIVYNDICQKLTFSIVESGKYFNNTAYFISNNKNIKFLTSLLNSLLLDWYYRSLSVQLGEKAIRMFSIYVEQIPIPQISPKAQQPFIELVNQILTKKEKGEDTSKEEHQIDQLVYKLYELTDDEIAIVEGNQ